MSYQENLCQPPEYPYELVREDIGDFLDQAKRRREIEEIVGNMPIDRLRELVEADRDGRCVVLTCKSGDTIYVSGRKVVKATITEIYILDDEKKIEYLVDFVCDCDCKGCPFNSWQDSWEGEWSCAGEYGNGAVFQDDFGKTWFLTPEAAEAALKGERDG